MTNIAHLTELQAVNRMLLSIGETPVNTLESGVSEAGLALDILRMVSREIQMQGWACNTWKSYRLSKNSDNQFVLGSDVLKVDTVNEHEYLDVVMKLSTDGTKYLLWDAENHTEEWTEVDEIEVDIVFLMNFEELTPALQNYIMLKAGHEFQKGAISSPVLWEFTAEAVAEARQVAEAEDSENDDTNCLRSSTSCYAVVWRNNELYGN